MTRQLTKFFIFLFFNKFEKQVALQLNYNKILILNFIVQRIFGSSSNQRYSIHHTSKVNSSAQAFIIENESASVLTSLAISPGCYISIHEGTTLKIGEHTLLASHVSIVTGNHGLLNRDKYVAKDVVIGKNCWLAKGVCIMPGVVLGNNVTVGANSVVTKSFPDNVVIAGIPATIIKHVDLNES